MQAPKNERNEPLSEIVDDDVNDLSDDAVDFLQRPWWRWAVMIIVGIVVLTLVLPVLTIIWG